MVWPGTVGWHKVSGHREVFSSLDSTSKILFLWLQWLRGVSAVLGVS